MSRTRKRFAGDGERFSQRFGSTMSKRDEPFDLYGLPITRLAGRLDTRELDALLNGEDDADLGEVLPEPWDDDDTAN